MRAIGAGQRCTEEASGGTGKRKAGPARRPAPLAFDLYRSTDEKGLLGSALGEEPTEENEAYHQAERLNHGSAPEVVYFRPAALAGDFKSRVRNICAGVNHPPG
ncbi:MAG: hypothetical protein D6815_08610 [Candidatus Dadabacteria bacterium]|nr:MAG: hypothetical protein D6815_08610 [Candidatus Dadabacteria bacterium]